MQPIFRTLLALYLAHLLTDFVFQSTRLVAQKTQRKLGAYLRHGLIHYLSAMAILGFFVPGSIVRSFVHVIVGGLTLLHLATDLGKIELSRRGFAAGAWGYLVDQFIHFVTDAVAAWCITRSIAFGALLESLEAMRRLPTRLLAVPVVYIAVVFGGGYLIRLLTRPLLPDSYAHPTDRHATGKQLQNAGLYIGWLERFLVLTALLLQTPATMGLILTAKSIARYPEFKSERFAEYFLIGTLLSISLAVSGAVLLSRIMFGHVIIFR
jgi:hypothetical protein